MHRSWRIGALVALTLALGACGGAADGDHALQESAVIRAPAAAEPEGPTAAERDYVALTESWSDAARAQCGNSLLEYLGARDLVDGALASAPSDADGAKLDEARAWRAGAEKKFEEIRPSIELGGCDGASETALGEALELLVRAGSATSAATWTPPAQRR
jgi:hypothetical protein